ncbi:Fructose-bisphosphate aldolase [Xylanimonas cellulosilytica DSM 15894]|uniref:Maltose/maltodextrin transport system permease protein n=1 Tax=Xylanimonas cellulosilytica (strain DSM 15894 / JCM 12276 / CECT 5975 / KCTC 9989 / LMG 20990 / NBRC 107835 / XIL07) TaxID=446471 RepID=D1BUF8_XYLCX|nr:sugar ABC transporter permease [Xylanimonas cellulosilytica]ACZ31171.1 Fructose-bisphosphate aldolase [Xylanimonas cellulosilytica DSM 15894]
MTTLTAEQIERKPPAVRTRLVDPKKVRLLSLLFMGLAHVTVLRDRVKGIAFMLVELVFLVTLPTTLRMIGGLITLGEAQPHLPIRERPNSLFMMIDGVMVLAVVAIFAAAYAVSVRSASKAAHEINTRGFPDANHKRFSAVADRAFPVIGLAPTFIMIAFFVVVPLVFSALVAFTNYAAPANIPPANTVDWVGLENFRRLFGGNQLWGGAVARVFTWTIVWAFLATTTTYIGGMLMAVVLKNSRLRITPLFRAIFILPYAIPGVVSLLVWRNMLNGAFGTVNRTLASLGITDAAIPWLTDPNLARFTMVIINLWVGFPYFMLLITGTMTSIPAETIEAAKVDGASDWQVFRRIQMPQIVFQTMPLVIMSFAHNINNFGAVFFLTGGGPNVGDSVTTSAGATDIMVSWIFNLTVNLQQYHNASVLAIMIFLIIAPFAIYNFRRTKSYKEGEL